MNFSDIPEGFTIANQTAANAPASGGYSDLPEGFTVVNNVPQRKEGVSLGPISGVAELGARGINALATKFGAEPRADQPIDWEIRLPRIGAPSAVGMAKGSIEGVKSAATLPGDVYAGRVNPESPEGIKRSVDLASLIATPSPGRTFARPAPATISPETVSEAANAGYRQAEAFGATAQPQALQAGLSRIGNEIAGEFHPELTPTTTKMVSQEAARYAPQQPDAMSALTGVRPSAPQPVPLVQELTKFREQLNQAIQNTGMGNKDRAAALHARSRIDDLMGELAPPELAQTLKTARANYGADMRYQAIDNLRTRAQDRVGTQRSVGDLEQAIQQELRSFIKPNRRGVSEASRSGFSQNEIDAMRGFVRNGAQGNTMRFLSNFLGNGGTFRSAVIGGILGHMFGPAAGVAAPAAGIGLRLFGNRSAANALEGIGQETLRRAPAAPVTPNAIALSRLRVPPPTAGLLPMLNYTTEGLPFYQGQSR